MPFPILFFSSQLFLTTKKNCAKHDARISALSYSPAKHTEEGWLQYEKSCSKPDKWVGSL